MSKIVKFGFWSIVLLTINSIIGTGIFLTPQEVITKAGVYTPLVYLIAAGFASILAITFASAAKYVNKNGASYAYAKAGFGDKVGFYVGITRFVAAAIAWGVMGTAVVRTSISIINGPDNITNTQITIGFIILMLILLGINLMGTSIIKIFSNVSTVGKILALLVAIIAGFFIFIKTGQNHFSDVKQIVDIDMNLVNMTGAVMAAFYAFTGFESVASAASEMESPEKNLPKAIPLAILIIAAIYISIVSIGMMVNPTAILESNEVVVLAAAFENPVIKQIIIYGAFVSMFGINIAASFHTPRIFEAISVEGQLPKIISQKNSKNVPIVAFAITGLLAIVIPMAFQYDMKGIMVISSISRFIQFIIVPLSVVGFYYGRNVNPIITTATKNKITDVIVPIGALVTSIFLLINFDWVGQFSIVDEAGVSSLNYFAVGSMVIGYIFLPIFLGWFNKISKERTI